MKLKKGALAIFASITAMSLTACGNQKDVTFWASFGEKYSLMLKPIINKAAKKLNLTVKYTTAGSIKNIHTNMVAAIGTSKYPSIAMGYPDHFVQYQGSDILVPLDDDFKNELANDYDKSYIPENKIYDKNGVLRTYGVPFNKSTELLGYNGVFVDYVAEKYSDPTLQQIPTTWAEWYVAKDDPSSKAGKYYEAFYDLVDNGRKLWAIQDADGHAHDFQVSSSTVAGKKLVLDYSEMDTETKAKTTLMGWDATDNAFITLLRQWGSEYTKLQQDQIKKHPKLRQGTVLFANKTNLSKTVGMLQYFNKMHKDKIFGLGGLDLGSNNGYCSEPYKDGRVMFMICSSGGLSYNTENLEKRFRLAPIPFRDASHKYVISQGMNLCLTKKADKAKSIKVMKALTTGEYQAEWSLTSGYFPASKSAEESKVYKEFISEKATNPYVSDKTKSAIYREGHLVNYNQYRVSWNRFVDDAFIDSAKVREVCGTVLEKALKIVSDADQSYPYENVLKGILKDSRIKGSSNIIVDTELKLN